MVSQQQKGSSQPEQKEYLLFFSANKGDFWKFTVKCEMIIGRDGLIVSSIFQNVLKMFPFVMHFSGVTPYITSQFSISWGAHSYRRQWEWHSFKAYSAQLTTHACGTYHSFLLLPFTEEELRYFHTASYLSSMCSSTDLTSHYYPHFMLLVLDGG